MARTVFISVLYLGAAIGQLCVDDFQGDKICDNACMSASHSFDKGAQPESDCVAACSFHCANSLLTNGVCDADCNTWDCQWDNGDCLTCAGGCFNQNLGDGVCNEACNVGECGWDFGDCNREESPAVIYVGTGEVKGNGSEFFPFNDLSEVLWMLFLKYNEVIILGGNHLLSGKNLATPILMSQRSLVSTVISGNGPLWPKIQLSRELTEFRLSHKVTFSNIYFEGNFDLQKDCWEPTCLYCPFTAFHADTGQWTNDRGEIIDVSKYASQSFCNEYHDKVFISVFSSASVLLENVTFAHFNQQLRALLLNECGSVHLRNVTFEKCMAAPSGLAGGLVQHTCPSSNAPYDCGEIVFEGGSVMYLNDGYEYRSDIVFSGFMFIGGIRLLNLTNITFSYNNIMVGRDSDIDSSAVLSLISATNFRQMEVSNCLFDYTLSSSSAAIYISADFTFPLKIINGMASEQMLDHLIIRNSTFRHNTVINGAVITLKYSGDHQNIRLSNLNFTDNLCATSIVEIENENINKDDWKGFTTTISGKSVTFPSRRVEFEQVLALRNVCAQVLSLKNIGNLYLSHSDIDQNGEPISQMLDFSPAFTEFSLNKMLYFTLVPQLALALKCSAILSLTNVLNLTYIYTDMQENYCPTGVSGVSLSGTVGVIDIHDDSFSHGNGSGALTLAVSEGVRLSGLRCWNNTNMWSKSSVCLDLRMQAPTDVQIVDSTFEANNGWFSTVIFTSSIRTLTLNHVFFYSNTAKYTCAGVLFAPISTAISQIIISSSDFVGNKAYTYGVVSVLDNDGLLAGNTIARVGVQIQNSTFRDNISDKFGASISLGTFIDIKADSFVRNCTFVNNTSQKGAGILAQFQTGVLTVDSCLFLSNKAPNGGAMYLGHFPTVTTVSAVHVTHCTFLNQTMGPAVAIEGQEENTDVFGSGNLFSGGDGGFLVVAGTLIEDSSTFSSIVAAEGPVIFAQRQAIVRFRNVTATNNHATSSGGAIFLTAHSNLTLEFSDVSNNSAVESGGAIYVDENSAVELKHSKFEWNKALIASALYASPADVIVVNCSFANNFVSNYGCILLTHCVSAISYSYFHNNTSNGNCPGLITSACVLTIADTEMADQRGRNGAFIQGIDHNSISIIRTNFRRGYASMQGGALFATLQSNLIIVSSLFESCFAEQEGGAISIQSSDLTILNSTFLRTSSNVNGGAVTMREGKFRLEDSEFREIAPGVGYIFGADEVNITNSAFRNGTGITGGTFTLKNIPIAYLKSNIFEYNVAEISAGALYLVSDGSQSVRNQLFLAGNQFQGNQAGKTDGGAMLASDVDLWMDGNKLQGNTALGKGGGLAVTCAMWDWCNLTVTNNEFRENSAGSQGGAIDWSGAFPRFDGNTYFNNTAVYGSGVSSFAVQLALVTPNFTAVPYLSTYGGLPVALKLTGVASGQVCTTPIMLGLFDHRGTLVTTDVRSAAKLAPMNASLVSISGNTDNEASDGKFTFKEFTVVGVPGTVQFLMISSDGVDVTMQMKVKDKAEYHDKVLVEVQFRPCVSGESQQSNVCFLCNSGTYSLDPALPCLLCPSQAVCYGNNTMVPKPGYWRISNNTDNFIECLAPEACVGSPDPPFISLTGLCAAGYSGNLCQQCVYDYSRTGRFLCSQCPSRASNIMLTSLVIILALAIVALIVWTAIKSAMRPQSLIAVYAKIFMNYLQMVVVSAALNLNWPTFAKTFLNSQQMAGGMAEQLFSFDCMLQDASLFTGHLYFTKIKIYSLLPVLLFVLAIVAWGTLAFCMKIENMIRKLAASAVIILFILHPSITKMMFSLFACMNLGDGKLWLINDLSIVCWDSEHIKEILTIVLPTLLVFVFGLPLLTLLILVVRRAALDTWVLKLMLCFLYKGYQRERFYWEFVILYRKVAMIAASVFLAPISIRVQALTVLALLLFSLFLQVQITPFFDHTLNQLEVKAILVSAITIYSGLYYDTNELSLWVKVLLFGLMIIANAYFLISWVRLVSPVLLRTLRERFTSLLRWRKTYRIQAMNSGKVSEIPEKPSLPNSSVSMTNPYCSGIELTPEVEGTSSPYQNPANTSVVIDREYTDQEEAKEPVHYTLVD